jgi:aspartate aminotransferase
LVSGSDFFGYINAPAIWQWVVAEEPEATIHVAEYEARRDLLCGALNEMGYQAPKPQGSFYLFPKTPIPDDGAFIGMPRARVFWPCPERDSGGRGTCVCL